MFTYLAWAKIHDIDREFTVIFGSAFFLSFSIEIFEDFSLWNNSFGKDLLSVFYPTLRINI